MAAPYGKRTVILRGHPIENEDGVASVAIKPGYLVEGVTSVRPHSTAAGAAAMAIALEKSEMGTGIDSTYVGVGAGSPDYAIGDKVKLGVFAQGQRFVGWIASGQNISEDQFLESAGNGTFRAHGAGVILSRALEAGNALGVALLKIRTEAM
jgi:hypothetical protein